MRTELSEHFYFELDTQKNILVLHKTDSKDSGLWIDFISEWGEFRKQKVGGSDLLIKATGAKKDMRICDLTLGLAQDSLKMIFLGAHVTGIEKNPWIYALVENALERVKILEAGRKMKLVLGSSIELIDSLLKDHDVFYLDPMFSHKRTALPKKGMQYLAEIAGEENEAELAGMMKKIIAAKKKLVVKRALKAPPIGDLKPKRQVEGKIIRFDIY